MQIVLTNKKPNSLITVINRRTLRSVDLLFNESCTFSVESKSEVNEYRQSYEAFGVDISIKEPADEFVNAPKVEEVKVEEPKPRRSRGKKQPVETVPVENISVKEVEAPKEEEKVEEPVAEEAAPVEEAPAEEIAEEK